MASGAVQLWNGKVLMDSGKVSTGEDCCCGDAVSCLYVCKNGLAALAYSLTFNGLAGTNCAMCPSLNTTFVLDYYPGGASCFSGYFFTINPFKLGTVPCVWRYNTTAICQLPPRLGVLSICFGVGLAPDSTYIIVAEISWFGNSPTYKTTFVKNYGTTRPDCLGLNGVNIPYRNSWGGCFAGTPTSIVTAL